MILVHLSQSYLPRWGDEERDKDPGRTRAQPLGQIQGNRYQRYANCCQTEKPKLHWESAPGPASVLQPTSCVTTRKLISSSGPQLPSEMRRWVQMIFAIASYSKTMSLATFQKFIEGFQESSWSLRKIIVFHFQNTYVSLNFCCFTQYPFHPEFNTLLSSPCLSFDALAFPHSMDSDRAANHSIDPTLGLSAQQLGT